MPAKVCIQGATDRIGKGRYDMPWIERELDPDFKNAIEEFPEKVLPDIYKLIEKYKSDRQIIVFKSRKQADDFIDNTK